MTTTALECLVASATPLPIDVSDIYVRNTRVKKIPATCQLVSYAANNILRVTRERDAAVSALRTILQKCCGEHQCKQEALHTLARIELGIPKAEIV